MIRKPNGSDAKRLGTGVLVAGMAAAGAVALASPAAAAGTLNSLSIAPTTGTADTSHCAKYVVSGTNTDGTNGTGTVTIQLSGDNNGSGNTTGYTCTNSDTPGTAQAAPRNRTTQVTLVNGQATFYVGSSQVGTVSIEADNGANTNTSPVGNVSSNVATLSVLQNANNGVSKITASPASLNVTAGQPARFVITATDANGNPVENATISRNDANTTANDTTANGGAAVTDSNGKATYTVPGSATTTGSTQTFYVNQTTNAGSTGGPDSGEPQTTATITVVQSKPVDTVALSCVNQASNPAAANSCVIPDTGTATLNAKATENGQPVSGIVVSFTTSGGNLSAATATTNTNGIATVTLTPTTSGTAENDTVSASATDPTNGAVTSGNETVRFQEPAASALVVSPGSESVAPGATITENVQVDDQFGNLYTNTPESVTFTVTGRNTTNGTVNTRSTGKASFTYTDNAPSTTSATTDSVAISSNPALTVTDNPNGSTGNGSPYTITYVSGGVTPSTVGLNFVPKTNGANPGANPACSTDTSDPKDTTTTTSSTSAVPTEVCAIVKNASGQMLAGQSVVFTVDKGKVGDSSVVTDADGMSYTATTNSNGVAVAYVTAATNGVQTIQAAVGTVKSNTLTDTYSSQNPVYTVTVTPATATIGAGNTQKFTAKAADQSGNGVSGQTLTVTQSGPGVLNNTTVVTAADGTASVNLTTQSSDSGNGQVTFTDAPYNANTNPMGCNSSTTGATCNATATYTVSQNTKATSVTVAANSIKPVLQTSSVTATAKNANGPIAGVTLSFAGTGANTPSGTAVTDSNGMATFSFKPYHKGATKITATDSADNVSGSVTVNIPAGEVTNKLTEASPLSGRVRMFDYPSVGGAGVQVNFYRVVSPTKNVYLGTAKTDANGRAYFQASGLKSGSTFTGVARSFYNTANFTNRYSNKVTYTVK